MGDIFAVSQSSILLPHFRSRSLITGKHPLPRNMAILAPSRPLQFFTIRSASARTTSAAHKQISWGIRTSVVSDFKAPTTFTADSAGEGIDVLPDTGGGSDDFGGTSGDGNGGNNNGNHNDNNDKGESNENEGGNKKKTALSMSQKLSLGYAFLVGAGGLAGYLKGGSQKSLIAGGLSASLLYYVYTILPTNPVFASSLGLGISGALLGVMGSRFKRSGKIFPAGVVSFVSLIMTGGYLHGILRSTH